MANSVTSLHDQWAARFEQQGADAYPAGRNPYNVGTMAHDRWAIGWHRADAAVCDAAR